MIYGYTLWEKVFQNLKKELPPKSIQNIKDFNKMEKEATAKDFVFFLKFTKGNRRLMEDFLERNIKMFPNPYFSLFIGDRIKHLKEVDKITSFPLKRESYSSIYEVERLPQFGEKIVMKIGNFHCGENKWLLNSKDKIPYIKQKLRNEPVLFEEFIPNARSIRVGVVGNPNQNENFFIAEHINSETAKYDTQNSWIKNINPIEKTYLHNERYSLGLENIDELIEETRMFAKKYNADLLGVDWVISEEKTGLLELNDIIGIPEDERVLKMFQNLMLNVSLDHLSKKDN